MTMKRQAEIVADVFAGLFLYFSLSYRNLTRTQNIGCMQSSRGIDAITDNY